MTMQVSIPYIQMRGGTSRAAFFQACDLPPAVTLRDRVLVAVMGGPDELQVDGIGGGHPLTSKIAIVSPSHDEDADVDYLFLQVDPTTQTVSTSQNCGNILAGVGPFAIETGLVQALEGTTRVKVRMLNSGNMAELTIATPDRQVEYSGDTKIDGVPGSAAAVVCDFLEVAGSMTGALLPTGNVVDQFDGIDVTCIDNGMPVVVLRAADLGLDGRENPATLDRKTTLKERLESIRIQAGKAMGLGDVSAKTVPKMTLISRPCAGGMISTQTFIPHVCHKSIGVLGAVSVASACVLPGSLCRDVASAKEGLEVDAIVEHPSGSITVRLVMSQSTSGRIEIVRSGVVRTARMIARGEVLVPGWLWESRTT